MADFLQKNGLPSSFSILLCFLSFISPVVMVSDIRYVLPCIVVAMLICLITDKIKYKQLQEKAQQIEIRELYMLQSN